MAKIGVVLLNMGGPDSIDAVKPFLFNIFSDPYIANFGIFQRPLAYLISRLRSSKVKRAYELIGGRSPLRELSELQAKLLEQSLGEEFSVKVAMNYWHPTVEESLRELERNGIRNIIALSLYPQYCRATSGSVIEKFKRCANNRFEYKVVDSWCDHPLFIESWCERIGESFFRHGPGFVLFSAHGIPVSLHKKGDPYISEVMRTVKCIVDRLQLKEWALSYQSRAGPVKWIGPSTEESLRDLAKKGIKKVHIVPVSFVSDHIETLYEIDIIYSELAKSLGLDLKRVPSLNDSRKFIEALRAIVLEKVFGGVQYALR